MEKKLRQIYHRLETAFGPQQWWPATTPFAVIIGAILTQGVSWNNVDKAMANLEVAGVLDPQRLFLVPEEELAELIRPSGYYRMKARKLESFLTYLHEEYQGSLEQMFNQPLEKLRPELLAVWGIGPETADSILLYAGGYATFVVDAYTTRIMGRLGLSHPKISYHDLQNLFMEHLPPDVQLFNDFHAFFVCLGKDYCKKSRPNCAECPLGENCKKVGLC